MDNPLKHPYILTRARTIRYPVVYLWCFAGKWPRSTLHTHIRYPRHLGPVSTPPGGPFMPYPLSHTHTFIAVASCYTAVAVEHLLKSACFLSTAGALMRSFGMLMNFRRPSSLGCCTRSRRRGSCARFVRFLERIKVENTQPKILHRVQASSFLDVVYQPLFLSLPLPETHTPTHTQIHTHTFIQHTTHASVPHHFELQTLIKSLPESCPFFTHLAPISSTKKSVKQGRTKPKSEQKRT